MSSGKEGGAQRIPKGPGGAGGLGRASPPQGEQQDWTQPSAVLTLDGAGKRLRAGLPPPAPLHMSRAAPAWCAGQPPQTGAEVSLHSRDHLEGGDSDGTTGKRTARWGDLPCPSHPRSGRSKEKPRGVWCLLPQRQRRVRGTAHPTVAQKRHAALHFKKRYRDTRIQASLFKQAFAYVRNAGRPAIRSQA